ncbi:MAG: hypothetical protein ACRCX2_35950 [Paraclostridium sp.]
MELIILSIKYAKRIVSILLILTMIASGGTITHGQTYQNYTTRTSIEICMQMDNNKITNDMKFDLLSKSKVISQDEFAKKLKHGDKFIMIDYHTNKYMVYKHTLGNDKCHADIEPIDYEVTEIVKSMYEDREHWRTRPVLVVTENGEVYCCSCYIVEHAGRDDVEPLKNTKDRSRDYGEGENLDTIKNGMDGHNCLHVRNSRNHFNNKVNKAHQKQIDYLENVKSKLK